MLLLYSPVGYRDHPHFRPYEDLDDDTKEEKKGLPLDLLKFISFSGYNIVRYVQYLQCMYVCMYSVCMYVQCKYVCAYVQCMYVCAYVRCIYVCMYNVRMYVQCMYVYTVCTVYVCTYVQ